MATISVSSMGVRVMDDFDMLPLFDAPPLDGPTTVRFSQYTELAPFVILVFFCSTESQLL